MDIEVDMIEVLKKQGWKSVKLNRTNLWNWNLNPDDKGWGDVANFNHISKWCSTTFGEEAWFGSLFPVKEFIFKYEKDLTLFLLKWHEYV